MECCVIGITLIRKVKHFISDICWDLFLYFSEYDDLNEYRKYMTIDLCRHGNKEEKQIIRHFVNKVWK